MEDAVFGGLFGVCIGDALGLPVEGVPRSYLKKHPVKGIGFGTPAGFIPHGWWSDDSSLTFCLAENLAEGKYYPEKSLRGCLIDLPGIAVKFCKWLYEGYWTPSGTAFGIGSTTAHAIARLRGGIKPAEAGGKDEFNNGNGSLMRILPLAFFLKDKKPDDRFEIIHSVSSITHAHPRSLVACGIYILFAINILKLHEPKDAYGVLKEQITHYYGGGPHGKELSHFERILYGDIAEIPEHDISSSGYVVDTLEASLWCFLNGESFEKTVLTAVNLGGDSDTTGAVTGGLAGLYYGFSGIPEQWVERLARKDDIEALARKLAATYGDE